MSSESSLRSTEAAQVMRSNSPFCSFLLKNRVGLQKEVGRSIFASTGMRVLENINLRSKCTCTYILCDDCMVH